MASHRHGANDRLRQLITETHWTLHALARAVNTTAAEVGLSTRYDRSAVAHWLSGSHPRGQVPQLLAEVFSRRLHREITPTDLGLGSQQPDIDPLGWAKDTDALPTLTRLARVDADPTGHARLRRLLYQHQKLLVPNWEHTTDHPRIPAPREPLSTTGETDAGYAVRRMTHLFALAIRSCGGGHARGALIAYLAHDFPIWLRHAHSTPRHRLSAVTDLVCLAGFAAFDEHAHGLAQRYYHLALALAVRAEDPARYAIALRLLSHQAHHLGHHHAALTLAITALAATGGLANPHIEAYLHAQAAVCHAALGDHLTAHQHLDSARHHFGRGTDPPPPVGAGHLAELAYCTAQTRTMLGDHRGTTTALQAALGHYPATDHYWCALTLGQLTHQHLDTGHLTHAHTTWYRFLHHYSRLHSTRADTTHTTLQHRLRTLHRNPTNRHLAAQATGTTTTAPATSAGPEAARPRPPGHTRTANPGPAPTRLPATTSDSGQSQKHAPAATSDISVEADPQNQEGTSDIAVPGSTGATSGNRRGRGALPTAVPIEFNELFATYTNAVSAPDGPWAADTVRSYCSRVRQFLAWLADANVDGDPLTSPAARDTAVHDYHTHLLTAAKRKPSTANAHLTAIDHLYRHLGLGPAAATRQESPKAPPQALTDRTRTRWLHAAQRADARTKALSYLEYYAGIHSSEAIALDLDDIRLSARTGVLINHKNGQYRQVPLHPQLRTALHAWIAERATWPGATGNPALFLNRRGGRLSTRGAYAALKTITADANPPGRPRR